MISVVIPAYNAEKYISKCIHSVLKQTYEDIEVIVIDDGSSDNTYYVCEEIKQLDSRVKLYSISNSGVSHARNFGIQKCSGEYLTFLDADDYLDLDIFQVVMDALDDPNMVYQWGVSNIVNYLKNDILYSKEDILHLQSNCIYPLDESLGVFFRACWGKLFNLSIIQKNHISFPEKLYMGEDALFLFEYFKYSSGLKNVLGRGYNYTYNAVSATHRYKNDLFDQSMIQVDSFVNIIKKQDISSENSYIVNRAFVNFTWWIYFLLVENNMHNKMNYTIFEGTSEWLKHCKSCDYYVNIRNKDVHKTYRVLYWLDRKCSQKFVDFGFVAITLKRKICLWFKGILKKKCGR